MIELLCEICDSDIFDDEDKLYKYLTTFQKDDDKSINKKIIIDNINLNDIDKVLNNYIDIYNKKFDFYWVRTSFNFLFSDNNIYVLNYIFICNKEIYKIMMVLLYFIDILKINGKNFININQMTINIIFDKCNMTNKYSKYMRLNPIERQINIVFGKNPQSLNNITNNILIKNKSHIIFNI